MYLSMSKNIHTLTHLHQSLTLNTLSTYTPKEEDEKKNSQENVKQILNKFNLYNKKLRKKIRQAYYA